MAPALAFLAVGAGAAVGAMLRYAVGLAFLSGLGTGAVPWATFLVNASGCFVIGLIATVIDEGGAAGPGWRLLLVTGLLGGYTTWSTFSLDALRMVQAGDWAPAALYTGLTIVLCLAGVATGALVGRLLLAA